jgi:hypothetical protein
LARALAKSGKLVEAGERYLEVTRLGVDAGDAVQRKAQDEAQAEYAQLEPRIPSLTLEVGELDRNALSVTIDGKNVPIVFLGEPRRVNPGSHQIVVTAGAGQSSETVEIAEGETKRVTLKLSSSGAPVAVASSEPSVGSAGPTAASGSLAEPGPPRDGDSRKALRTAGWISLGVGGAALVAGGVTGLLAMSKRSELDCPEDSCTGDKRGEVDSYNSLRTVSSIGLIGGAVLAGAGGVLLFTSSRSERKTGARLVPLIGVSHVGLRGTF